MLSKRLVVLALWMLPLSVMAVEPPANLEPLPEVPPPPNGVDLEKPATPEITTTKKGQDVVEEYRMNGELYMMKVTPPHGKSYYMMKEDKDGAWSRMDGPGNPMSIPKWVLFRF